MSIDQILHPRVPTAAEQHAALGYVFAVSEAIREAGEVPSGQLYSLLCDRLSLPAYQSLIAMLVRIGLVEQRHHLLRWIGRVTS